MTHGSAKQRFYVALSYLVSGNEPLTLRLTHAADALIGLELNDLPEGMRDEFQQLRAALMRQPLRWPSASMNLFISRKVTPKEAKQLATKMLDMYTELFGGLAA